MFWQKFNILSDSAQLYISIDTIKIGPTVKMHYI